VTAGSEEVEEFKVEELKRDLAALGMTELRYGWWKPPSG
jgi:hypothetical protein